MLQVHKLPNVGPGDCFAIGASIRVVKERVNNSETLLGWVRGAERDACPIGGLACYMVWLIDLFGNSLLRTMEYDLNWLLQFGPSSYKPRWRQMYLLYGADPFQPMSYTTHNDDVHAIMDAGKQYY